MSDQTPATGPANEMSAGEIRDAEAAAFRRLLSHLSNRPDVQNIDLMNLAGFCRNCLANWYRDAATEAGHPIDKDAAREHVYGMPYEEWREKYQREASDTQKQAFERNRPQE